MGYGGAGSLYIVSGVVLLVGFGPLITGPVVHGGSGKSGLTRVPMNLAFSQRSTTPATGQGSNALLKGRLIPQDLSGSTYMCDFNNDLAFRAPRAARGLCCRHLLSGKPCASAQIQSENARHIGSLSECLMGASDLLPADQVVCWASCLLRYPAVVDGKVRAKMITYRFFSLEEFLPKRSKITGTVFLWGPIFEFGNHYLTSFFPGSLFLNL